MAKKRGRYLLTRNAKLRTYEEPCVRFLGEEKWELYKPYRLIGVLVPRGFEFDGASIPRCLWWWNHPEGVAFPAAIIHDFLYATQPIDRRSADLMFYAGLLHTGVRPSAAFLMWTAVRLFGSGAWNKRKKNTAKHVNNRSANDDV